MIAPTKLEIKNDRVANEESTPTSATYSTVVSRDSVRIPLTIAASNELEVTSADVQGVFLTAPKKKSVIWSRGQSLAPKRARRSSWVRRQMDFSQ